MKDIEGKKIKAGNVLFDKYLHYHKVFMVLSNEIACGKEMHEKEKLEEQTRQESLSGDVLRASSREFFADSPSLTVRASPFDNS